VAKPVTLTRGFLRKVLDLAVPRRFLSLVSAPSAMKLPRGKKQCCWIEFDVEGPIFLKPFFSDFRNLDHENTSDFGGTSNF